MGMGKYSLAVSSKIHLAKAGNLEKPAYALGQQIASLNWTLLSAVQPSLAYKVAQGATDKNGYSIGFSPASNLRDHVLEGRLPTDAYSWIYFSNLKANNLANCLISQAQALILIGATMDDLGEFALALASLIPVAVLLDEVDQANNGLLNYLQALPLEQQRQVIVHQDPKILLNTLQGILDNSQKDCSETACDSTNQLFNQILKDVSRQQA